MYALKPISVLNFMKFVRKFFLKSLPAKNKTWALFLGSAFLGLLTPLKFAQAAWWDAMLSPIIGSVVGIFSLLFQLILAISVFFSSATSALLKWVVIDLNIPLTRCPEGFESCVVKIGWAFSRDLANMLFVLIFVAIAFAYILKLETFGMKKALPMLIIVALLINFSQVFVGVIVDISQIAMNTFITPLQSSNVFAQLHGFGERYGDILANFSSGPEQIKILTQTVVIIVFNFVMGMLFFMYFLAFLTRIIAIWVLTILAPLAFAALVLPQTKSWWSKWMSNLLQWSFLGVIALFFLFFGFYLLSVSGQYIYPDIGDVGFGSTPILYSILPYLVVIVFLFIGFQLAISSAPAGAHAVMNLSKKAGIGLAAAGGLAAGSAIGRRVSPKVEAWGERLAKQGEKPGEEKGIFAKALGKTVRFGEKWTGRGVATGAGRIYRQVKTKDEDEIQAGIKEATNKHSADNFRIINEELLKPDRLRNWNRISGVLNGTVKNGDTDDIQEALRNKTLSGEVVGRALLTAQRAGPPAYRPIAKALYGRLLENPEEFGEKFRVKGRDTEGNIIRDEDGNPVFSGEEFIEGTRKKDRKTLTTAGKIIGEIPEKLSNADITAKILGDTIDKGKAEGKEFEEHGGKRVLQQLVKIRGGDLISGLIRRPETKEGRAEILNTFRKMNPEDLYKQGADGLFTHLNSSAAQGAGVASPLLPRETTDLRRLLREKARAKARGIDLETSKAKKLRDLTEIWTGEISPSGVAPSAPPEITEIEKIKRQIDNLEKEIAKPYSALPQLEREALRKKQEEYLEGLKTRLKELKEKAREEKKEQPIEGKINDLLKQAQSQASKKMYRGKMSTEQIDKEVQTLESALSDIENYYGQALSQNLSGKVAESLKDARIEVQGVKSWLQGKKFVQEKEDEARGRYLQTLKDSVGRLTDMYKRDLKLSDKEIERRLQKTLGKKVMREVGGAEE